MLLGNKNGTNVLNKARFIQGYLNKNSVPYPCTYRFYAKNRYDQDEESKKYEKDISDMINQVNQELLQERLAVNNKFLKQNEQAELELSERKKNTFNKYTSYTGESSGNKESIVSNFQPDRPKSDAYKKQLLTKSMNYKLWVLSGLGLVLLFGGNDIYNYFMNKEKFVEMNDTIREVQQKKVAKKQDQMNKRVRKLNKILNGDNAPVISWTNGDFSAILADHFGKDDITTLAEDVNSKNLFIIDKAGDLYRYNPDISGIELIIKGHVLTDAKLSNGKLYLSNKKNEIEILPLDEELFKSLKTKRSWVKPWSFYTVYDNKIKNKEGKVMKFSKYEVGNINLLGETLSGKIYSACTISLEQQKADVGEFNKGQFGLPEYPPSKLISFAKIQKADIEEYPSDQNNNSEPSNEEFFDEQLYLPEDKAVEVELLTSSFFAKSESITRRKIVKFSAGKNHAYFIDSNGSLLTFGDNSVGQLYLQKIGTMKGYPIVSPRLPNNVKCIDVKCIEDNTYFLVSDDSNKQFVLSCGSGMMGELGNGQFKINQADATKLLGLKELNYDSVEMVGGHGDKRFAVLKQSNSNLSLLLWGNNKDGELPGLLQGKRYNSLQQTDIKLARDSRVLLTEHYGTIIY